MAAEKVKAVRVPDGLEAITYDPNDRSSLEAARKLLGDKIFDLERAQARKEEAKAVEPPKA